MNLDLFVLDMNMNEKKLILFELNWCIVILMF